MIPAALMTLIEASVDAMTVAGGYNFAYGAPDVFPVADTGLPLPYIETPDEIAQPADGHPVGRYTIDAPLAFRVLVPAPTDPVTIDEQAGLVIADFKQLMQDQHDALKAAGMQYADFTGSTKAYRLVRDYPAQVTINFNIRFRQLKSNPGG